MPAKTLSTSEDPQAECARAERRERRRIAHGLHDQVGQILGVAKIKLGQALAAGPPGDVAEPVAEARRLVDRAIREIRSLTFDLSSPTHPDLGLAPALEGLAERARERHGLPFRFAARARLGPTAPEEAALVYAIVRELIWNVVKHAGARRGVLEAARDGDRLRVTVSDDGAGFRGDRPCANGGVGLSTARRRLEHRGGSLEIGSAPGGGARVTLTLPLDANGSSGRSDGARSGGGEPRR